MEDRVENLMEAGVLDPAKVTRSGLMNACSIAGIMLTTQVRFTLCNHSRSYFQVSSHRLSSLSSQSAEFCVPATSVGTCSRAPTVAPATVCSECHRRFLFPFWLCMLVLACF